MIKIKNKIIEDKPKSITCESCGAELEYEDSDLKVGLWGCKGFDCPECGEFVFCSDRVAEPKYPDTFWIPKNPKKIEDKEINILLGQVVKSLKNCEVGEFTMSGTGDTMVIGLKFEDKEEYYVCKNAATDEVWHDD